ncbi:uncharacterized protein AMSG_07569 [Thecamonas trahens ATCC 50062]|uniref:THH1/TOM1/TOM3 domain-containing protein n=1 Tax=Thecamonas trahens ATCC 50062 TaxID=461836 RepID=A0A0L0DGC7_THETB|nr:hypothetical protein AMSG_07569 [Thecamonas trahens ATCC 50062]KNC51387.1 hypothetical protein AMSG_07569 [Thecamonas trahens ATCC 50062]|eukprot:XP_013756055.1 hypothetical protein AMSG_07569 [Thecamonas trahens ATCC 50062]
MQISGTLLTLTLMYSFLFKVCLVQLGRVVYYKHRFFSAQVGFLVLCLLWMAVRVVFFVSVQLSYSPSFLLIAVYELPVNIEFGVFSLLVLFTSSMVLRHTRRADWDAYLGRWANGAFLGVNGVLFCLYCLYVYWVLVQDAKEASSSASQLRSIFTASVFCLLEILLAVAYFHLYTLVTANPGIRLPFSTFGDSQQSVLALLAALLVLFLSRCAYDIAAACDAVTISIAIDSPTSKSLIVFFSFFSWEIVPPSLVIALVGHVPSSSHSSASATAVLKGRGGGFASTHSGPLYGSMASLNRTGEPATTYWAPPHMYGSDDDEHDSRAHPASPVPAAALGMPRPIGPTGSASESLVAYPDARNASASSGTLFTRGSAGVFSMPSYQNRSGGALYQ